MDCTKLAIDLEEGEHSEDLKALCEMHSSTQQNIIKVQLESIHVWEGVEEWRETNIISKVFQCLEKLENLQQLIIRCGANLPVTLLADVLQHSPKLQILRLNSVLFSGNEGNLESLTKVVQDQKSLTFVSLSDIQLRHSSTSSRGLYGQPDSHVDEKPTAEKTALCLEPFLVSLAQACPTMRDLELEDLPVSANALNAIATSPHLRGVELWNLPTVGENILDFANNLCTNVNLQKLELCDCDIGPQGAQCLTTMLLQNSTLTSVVLDIDWGNEVMFGKPIAAILQSNQTLTRLHLICRQEHSNAAAEAYAQIICQSLGQNKTLQRLALEVRQSRVSRNDNSRLAAAFADPLRRALDQNYSLQEFSLLGGRTVTPISWRKDVAFHLGLNRAGRQQWMSSFENQKEWMDALLRHKHDLSTSFFFLSLCPHLLSPSIGRGCF